MAYIVQLSNYLINCSKKKKHVNVNYSYLTPYQHHQLTKSAHASQYLYYRSVICLQIIYQIYKCK